MHGFPLMDRLHLPHVERLELRLAALGAQADAAAVVAFGIDARGHALAVVDEDLDHAPVDEHGEFERLVRCKANRGRFRGSAADVGSNGGAGRVKCRQAPSRSLAQHVVGIAAVPVEGDAGELLPLRRHQHVEGHHGRRARCHGGANLHRIAAEPAQQLVAVAGNRLWWQGSMFTSQSAHSLHGAHSEFTEVIEGQPPRQGHDLVPAGRGLAGVHVEDDDHVVAVRRRGRRVNAGWPGRPHVELAAGRHLELLPLGVVVADEVLAAAHVTEEEQDVAVADGPEIGAGAVVAHERVVVVLDERVQVFPMREVLRAQEEVCRHRLAVRAARRLAGGERVVEVSLLPDARIKHPVWELAAVRGCDGDHRCVAHLAPVQQQRV